MDDIEIIKILENQGYMRRCDLIQELHKKFPDRGYSIPTINRGIKRLVKSGDISILKGDDLKSFGIDELNKNASYLFLQKTFGTKQFLDEVVNDLDSDNREDILTALDEIYNIRELYHINPIQLDKVVNVLDQDVEVVKAALLIIYDSVLKYKIEPKDKEILKNNFISLLKRFKTTKSDRIIVSKCIELLSYYDESNPVIEQLKYDAYSFVDDFEKRNDYTRFYGLQLIEKNQVELYKFDKELRKQGRVDIAKHIQLMKKLARDEVNQRRKQK